MIENSVTFVIDYMVTKKMHGYEFKENRFPLLRGHCVNSVIVKMSHIGHVLRGYHG